MDVLDSGSSGCGRCPVKVVGRELGWLLEAMGREALNGRDVGIGDVELGRI